MYLLNVFYVLGSIVVSGDKEIMMVIRIRILNTYYMISTVLSALNMSLF